MRKNTFLLLFVIFNGWYLLVSAQEKKLTYQDIIYMNPSVFPKNISQIQWVGDSDYFSFVEGDELLQQKPGNNKPIPVLHLNGLNSEMLRLNEDSLKNFPRVGYQGKTDIFFTHDNSIFLYNWKERELSKINSFPKEAENVDIEQQTFQVAYTKNDNLFISMNNQEIQVTNDGGSGIVNGKTVHRNEFGIHKGTFWSPGGDYLAFYRMDESMVSEYPLVDVNTRVAEIKPERYPMAGMTSHEVKTGVYNIRENKLVFLNTGAPADQYLTNITWSPDGQFIYIAVLNRDQNHLLLNQYDVKSGKLVKTLFEEKNHRYVEPLNGMYFLDSDPGKFVWMSKRDGFNHLFLYDTSGRLLDQLTKGQWDVTAYYGSGPKGEIFYFCAAAPEPVQQNIFKVDINNGEIVQLTSVHGTHSAMFNQNMKYFIDVFSNTETARQYQIINNNGKEVQILLIDSNPLKDYQLGEMSIFRVPNPEGTELYCRLIKPAGFDSTKKYPLINYVYGGPHSQLVSDSWLGGAQLFLYYLAQEGYLVFTLDNRGTSNRGFEFESSIFRNLGKNEVEDQMAGMKYIMNQPFVDIEKIGVDGWSYGGFMTISLLAAFPDVFKVGVAGGPVTDWKFYEVMYGERYMDTPQTNEEGYMQSSLLEKVKNLKSKLLIIHGTNDGTVVWQNSLLFLKKCIDEGIQVDYFVYPGHAHNVRGKDRMHMYEKIVNYFNSNLQ